MSTPKRAKRQPWPKIRQVTNNGKLVWQVDGRMNGAGKRHFFETKVEAETKADQLRAARKNEGFAGVALSEKLRVEALECDRLLSPMGVSLSEAVRYYISHARPDNGEKTVAELRDAFLESKTREGCRPAYLQVQTAILGRFIAAFGTKRAHEVAGQEIEEWLHGQEGWSSRTRLNYHRDLRNLFGFAIRKGWCASNPLARVETPRVDEAPPPGILTVAQAKRLLAAAEELKGRMTPFYAIGLFAGLRTEELKRLDWQHIDMEDKTIDLDATITKTRDTRYVTMSDNLVAWLKPYVKESGPVRPPALRYHAGEARKKAGITEWPDNALRHSFGSYHYVEHNNAPLTAAMLGHKGSTRTLFEHYRRKVKPKDAEAYWELKPV